MNTRTSSIKFVLEKLATSSGLFKSKILSDLMFLPISSETYLFFMPSQPSALVLILIAQLLYCSLLSSRRIRDELLW